MATRHVSGGPRPCMALAWPAHRPNRRRARRTTSERKGDLRRSLSAFLVGLLIGFAASPWLFSAAATPAPILTRIHHVISQTHHYQAPLGSCCRRYRYAAERTTSTAYRWWVLRFWQERRDHAATRWATSPVRSALLCIHAGEGAWTANTGNGYYGGLQMNTSFMVTYAPSLYHTLGTADKWTPLEQLTAAARAVRVRGYSPWPQTRIPCGV